MQLFQITGSASFAVRAALEEAEAVYTTVDVHPRRRDEAPGFAEVNPLRRVPSLRAGRRISTRPEQSSSTSWSGSREAVSARYPASTAEVLCCAG